jgi:hypothetical protein
MASRHGGWLGLLLSVALTWFVFGALWWAPLIFAESYQALGGVFPTPTEWVIAAAAEGAPLACAVLFTLVLVRLFRHPGPRRPWIIAGIATFAALWAVATLVAMAMPIQKCSFHWPDLPWERARSERGPECSPLD